MISFLLLKRCLMGKMINDKSGKCYAVPSVWQINNVHFPQKYFKHLISAELNQSLHRHVDSFFNHAGLMKEFRTYRKSISYHYALRFRSRLIALALRMGLLYRHNPAYFGHNPLFVYMKIPSYWQNILFTRIVQCNRFGANLPVPPDKFNFTRPQLLKEAEWLYTVFEPLVDELYPQYVKKHNELI